MFASQNYFLRCTMIRTLKFFEYLPQLPKRAAFGDPLVVIGTVLIVAENVAENMTITRKAIGTSPRLRSHAHDNEGLHGNGHTFRFTNHNKTEKVSPQRQL